MFVRCCWYRVLYTIHFEIECLRLISGFFVQCAVPFTMFVSNVFAFVVPFTCVAYFTPEHYVNVERLFHTGNRYSLSFSDIVIILQLSWWFSHIASSDYYCVLFHKMCINCMLTCQLKYLHLAKIKISFVDICPLHNRQLYYIIICRCMRGNRNW